MKKIPFSIARKFLRFLENELTRDEREISFAVENPNPIKIGLLWIEILQKMSKVYRSGKLKCETLISDLKNLIIFLQRKIENEDDMKDIFLDKDVENRDVLHIVGKTH